MDLRLHYQAAAVDQQMALSTVFLTPRLPHCGSEEVPQKQLSNQPMYCDALRPLSQGLYTYAFPVKNHN